VLGDHCGELEDRVDRQQLDARPVVELTGGNTFENAPEGRRAPRVAIVNRIREQAIL